MMEVLKSMLPLTGAKCPEGLKCTRMTPRGYAPDRGMSAAVQGQTLA